MKVQNIIINKYFLTIFRLSQEEAQPILEILRRTDGSAHSTQEAASNLQHKFECLIEEDKEMHEKASKGTIISILFLCLPINSKLFNNIKKYTNCNDQNIPPSSHHI